MDYGAGESRRGRGCAGKPRREGFPWVDLPVAAKQSLNGILRDGSHFRGALVAIVILFICSNGSNFELPIKARDVATSCFCSSFS